MSAIPPAKRQASGRAGDLGRQHRQGKGGRAGSPTLLLVLLAALAAFLVRQSGGLTQDVEGSPTPLPTAISVPAYGPAIVSPSEMLSRAATSGFPTGFPLYWAGEVPGTSLELTVLPDGTWAVRYLATGSPAGATADALTIVTFYQADGASRVASIAEQADAKSQTFDNGLIAASESADSPTISLALQDYPLLLVVTSSNPDSAWELISQGVIRQIGK